MKKLTVTLLIALSVISLNSFSQVSRGGLPYSFQHPEGLDNNVATNVMPAVDVISLLAEDSINNITKEVPWRFGENIPVSLNPGNSGTWDILPDGGKLWRLGIRCPGAFTINLAFDRFYLPSGATLFIYNQDKTDVIGAFTDLNNRDDSVFATTLVTGEQIVIEYYEPAEAAFTGALRLNRVTHGYRNAFDYLKSFGQSGSCNNNVKCPEAAGWENQVRSACMLVTGGNGFCSGSLVNNTSQDGTPYVLTANHCYSSPATWVFWFNWESPTCANPSSSPPYNSVSGATLKARNSASDFCLVQMNSVPPVNYGVYYAGWNREDVGATSGAGIHHPSGDIKKISYSATPYTSDTWSGTPANSHWKVNWSDGVTEGGSSGSPIFDQLHRVVGQLHGGPSSCSSSQLWDFYGKFSMSWDYGTTPATRLKDWLDPTNTGGNTLNGFDPNMIPVVTTLDATNIMVTAAKVNGSVTPNGIATSYHFDWGTSTAFGNSTTTLPAGSGTTPIPVNAILSGLTAGTQYFFRLTGVTASGNYLGDTLSFTTELPLLSVSPPNQNVDTSSGETQFKVTSNIDWTVTCDSTWCTVTSSGTGNDTIFASYTANPSTTSRVALVTVSGAGLPSQSVTVTQAGVPIRLSVTPPNQNVTNLSGDTPYIVRSNANWSVITSAIWITVVSSGTGNDTLHVSFLQNMELIPRVATMTISAVGGGTVDITLTQAGAPAVLEVTPVKQDVAYAAGSTNFTVTSNTDWTVASDASWCTATAGGSGNGTIVATYTENTASEVRTARLSVTVPGLPVQTVNVNQAKSTIGLDELNAGDLMIYPNPAKGVFEVVSGNAGERIREIQVIDLTGTLILRRQCNGETRCSADISAAAAGSYQVIIKTDNLVVKRKLVIIK